MSIEIDGKSLDIKAEKLEQLKALFPEFFSEGKIDLTRIKHVLGDEEITTPDHYELSWAGKAEARREIQRQTTATLIPDREGSINFDTSENIFIEGENLEVLRTLQKSYFGSVKMIYIDPPYNTGSDSFIYPDDYAERKEDYEKRTGQKNGEGYLNKQDLWKKNSKESGQYHSVWLSMMYPRLYLSRNLLKEDGVIFVSIGDDELGNLIILMNEIFGQENQLAVFTWKSRAKPTNAGDAKYRPQKVAEYILAYAKNNAEKNKFNVVSAKERTYPHVDADGKGNYRITTILTSNRGMFKRETMRFEIGGFKPDDEQRWKAGYDIVKAYYDVGRIGFNDEGVPYLKHFEGDEDEALYPLYTYMDTDLTGTAETGKSDLNELVGRNHGMDTVKPVNLLRYIIASTTNENDIILDFFAGSGTTAQAVMELNRENGIKRKFILVQMPELSEGNNEAKNAGFDTIAKICKTRIQKFIEQVHSGNNGKMDFAQAKLDLGFKSYKLHYSNFKKWKSDIADREELLKQLEVFKEPLANRIADSYYLLVELLLKSGLPLSARVEKRETLDNTPFYVVENGQFIYALDSISDGLLKDVEAAKPTAFITLGNLFTGEKADEQITNWKLQLKESNIEFKII
jgi:adenine-specific DNA-methyltransferase